MNFIQRWALNIVLSALQASIKNPLKLAKEYTIMVQLRDILNQIIERIRPN